jgi:hypothetical protein
MKSKSIVSVLVAVLFAGGVYMYSFLGLSDSNVYALHYLGQVLGPQFNLRQYSSPSSLSLATYVPYALPQVNILSSIWTQYGETPSPVSVDYNGDGLSDLVYSKMGNMLDASVLQYVLLNKGESYELAYICIQAGPGLEYNGDCSAGSPSDRAKPTDRSLGPYERITAPGYSATVLDYVPYSLPEIHLASYMSSPGGSGFAPDIMEVNGDGLFDLVFSVLPGYNIGSEFKQYVLLNTGIGFEVAYYCRASGGSYEGDCADVGRNFVRPSSRSVGTLQDLDQVGNINNLRSVYYRSDVPYSLPRVNIVRGYDRWEAAVPTERNGDGIGDIMYSYRGLQYVLLGNGQGFDLVYYCEGVPNGVQELIEGDCAQ